MLQEQEQEQEQVAQVPQQQEPVAQQEDAAVQHGLGGHGDPEQSNASGQLADAPEGGGALSAVSQHDTPRPPFAGWQGGKAGGSTGAPKEITGEVDKLQLPVTDGKPRRRRMKLNKFV